MKIEVMGLTKAFGSIQALAGLNMSVPKASVYGLVGPNGAGKTTALHHISGAMRPDAGVVMIDGEDVFENVKIKTRIATIPGDIFYHSQDTIEDTRDIYAALYESFDKQHFEQLASTFSLDPKLKMKSLSKGMAKQAAFWIALSQRPDVLLLDEPVDGLDPAARRKVWSIVMDEVADRGMTVLVSSHNLRELTDVCDRVGIMESGRMHLERSLEDLQENFVKLQLAFEDDALACPDGFQILHEEHQGRLFTLVVKGSAAQVEKAFATCNPTFTNILPLSLEEIFIYELGGADHGFFAD